MENININNKENPQEKITSNEGFDGQQSIQDTNQMPLSRAFILGSLIMAIAIIISPLIYGGAKGNYAQETQNRQGNLAENQNLTDSEIDPNVDPNILTIKEDDHVMGAKNPKITFIEYSDYDCPFCSRIHPTMQQLVETYPEDVAWIYRHFPLESIHPNARQKSLASECIALLGGEDAFWTYTDTQFSGQQIQEAQLLALTGVDVGEFTTCIENQTTASRVDRDINDAIALGIQGTPYTIALLPNGETLSISGAQPYEVFEELVKAVIEK